MKRLTLNLALAILAVTCSGRLVAAGDYSPYVDRAPGTRLFWGDTHLHTTASSDASARGNRLDAEAAYRFARGEEVTSSTGVRAKLKAPLDFLVIADHSDGMGFFGLLAQGHPRIVADERGKRWHELVKAGKGGVVSKELIAGFAQGDLPWKTNDPALMTPVWQANLDAAEKFNEPGRFSALIGYEWTSLVKGNNLHRVVIYRDGAAKAGSMLPYTLGDSADPEDLWAHMDAYEKKTAGNILAIPHNSNLSNGMMFADVRLGGEPLTGDYARRRQRWEPLVEISQIKGDSETHPLLSPNDEFSDFETWDLGNLDLSEAKTNDMLRYEYVREALKRGLARAAALGANPFEFGIIASTDSHTSLATAGEDNFFGKHSSTEPRPGRATDDHRSGEVGKMYGWEQVSSGYAAVWAAENTREAIWDALKRRETYGTTGSRISVRLFGGWDFTPDDAHRVDLAAAGYARGVPMGGTLKARRGDNAPRFLVAAQRDPTGANLDRIQVVKGWLDSAGRPQERIYNVAWSGQRSLSEDGSLPAVGSSVDLTTASWTNTIGAGELVTVWQDPDFDPELRAFYYVRVLEIPTPRWPAYDAMRFGLELPQGVRLTQQERAYTSPIWYSP